MDTTPVTGLDELDRHLDDLVRDTSIPVNAKLLDDVELQLTESNIPPLVVRFLPKLTAILKQYKEDPTVIVSLTVKLLSPVSFTQVLSLASEESLIQALDSPAPAANILAMTVIHKAAASPADAAILSAMPQLVAAFIRRWLASPQVEVGQKGGKVLGDLLDIDCELPPPPPPSARDAPRTEIVLRRAPGQAKLWRLLFLEKGAYMFLLALCSGRHPDTNDAHQLSLAQGRLLRLLPRLAALNFQAVSRSAFTATTPVNLTNGHGGDATSGPRPCEGLLQFAALRMVDKSDVLMHLSWVYFFEAFLSLMRVTEHSEYKLETIRAIVAEAAAGDQVLKEALLTLPDRTVEEEAEGLRRWLLEVMPGESVRLAVR
ncbi:hypothetical protein B0T16DRAFT_461982 [Cercophora newfieldiana]|uniref:DNA mismatch repair protein HSM3 N-terminal domain-containing protein n=1 Tax=Cercophora newfieldiana TaxID=92897 RepID=A0AA40CM20_9PEZI|nr:hypothetical protein B0T16DRAFT_461982 [Cercophora newfieldiana]